MSVFRNWIANEDGATMIEYSLLVAFLSVAIIGLLFSVGAEISAVFAKVAAPFGG